MFRRAPFIALLILSTAVIASAMGPPEREESRSVSIGRTNRGRLLHGVPLTASAVLQTRSPNNRFGTQELVDLVEWAAAKVAEKHPGSTMLVGDLSRARGGRLRPHRSHRTGRDADVGFYLSSEDGEMLTAERFVRMSRSGVGQSRGTTYKFDVARNWELVANIVGQDIVPVQYMMIIRPLKDMLLAEGRRQNASAELLQRVEAVVGPRSTGRGRWARYGTHNSHFHIRIYCPADDRPRCSDQPPYWDWIQRPPRTSSSNRRRPNMRARRSMRARSNMRSRRQASRSRSTMRRRMSARPSMGSNSMRTAMDTSAEMSSMSGMNVSPSAASPQSAQ